MVYRRLYRSRRKIRTPFRRRYGNRFQRSRVPRPMLRSMNKRFIPTKVFTFKQSVSGLSIASIGFDSIVQSASIQNFNWYFSINDIPQAEEFSALYEQYRIFKIVVNLIPSSSQYVMNTTDGTGSSSPSVLASVIDWSNSSELAVLTDYERYQNFKMQSVFSKKIHTRIFTPACLIDTLSPEGANAFNVVSKEKWLSFINGQTYMYGLKVFLGAYSTASTAQSYWIQVKYYLGFRNVR